MKTMYGGFSFPEEIKLRLADELTPAPNRKFYICPLCGSGKGLHATHTPTGALHLTGGGTHWTCFSCREGGDIFDLVAKRDHVTLTEARRRLMEKYLPLQGYDIGQNTSLSGNQTDIPRYIDQCFLSFPGSEGEEYMTDRGFSPEVCEEWRIGYDRGKDAIVIPYPEEEYYITRSLSGKEYRKPAGRKEPLFLLQAPQLVADGAVLYVTEGQLDALSLYQAGADLVAACGGGGDNGLSGVQDAFPGLSGAVIVRDRDNAGEKAAARFQEALEGQGIPCFVAEPPEGCKDANDALVEDEGALVSLVAVWEAKARALPESPSKALQGAPESPVAPLLPPSPDNVREYLSGFFLGEVEAFLPHRHRKSGFVNIDADISLYPGLYILGAVSSLGKTTFAHQMADQLAERGEHVLYFSTEQSKLEMVSKGLSRLSALLGDGSFSGAVSAIDIRSGKVTSAVQKAMDRYLAFSGNLFLVEGGIETSCEEIRDYVSRYISRTGERPVVFVDYLQMLRSSPAALFTSGKENVDACIRILKELQVRYGLVVFVISSFNRSNYLLSADFESFKESGDLEYTADVMWGMQLRAMSGGNTKEGLSRKREKLRQAKLETPRKVDVLCLKNRHGPSSFCWGFDYYPEYDLFLPEQGPEGERARRRI